MGVMSSFFFEKITRSLDKFFEIVYICAVACFCRFFLHVGGGVDMVSLKRVLVPTVKSFFPHIVVLTSCSRLATL